MKMKIANAGLNDTHLAEKLREVEGIPIGRETVRQIRIQDGLPAPLPRRPPVGSRTGAVVRRTSSSVAHRIAPRPSWDPTLGACAEHRAYPHRGRDGTIVARCLRARADGMPDDREAREPRCN